MDNMSKLIEAVNLPKKIYEGAESFLKTLLGPAVTETGEWIGDQIRYRRFRNQVVIFSKAKEILDKNGLKPKEIKLKVLSPLIEYSSLEEEEEIQIVWSKVIANISSYDTDQVFNIKCIEILKEITAHEIFLLDFLFDKFRTEEKVTLEKWKQSSWLSERDSVWPENSMFKYWEYKEDLQLDEKRLALFVDRLIAYGILKQEALELNKSTNVVGVGVGNLGIDVPTYELETSDRVHFTNFGLYFVRLCKFMNEKE